MRAALALGWAARAGGAGGAPRFSTPARRRSGELGRSGSCCRLRRSPGPSERGNGRDPGSGPAQTAPYPCPCLLCAPSEPAACKGSPASSLPLGPRPQPARAPSAPAARPLPSAPPAPPAIALPAWASPSGFPAAPGQELPPPPPKTATHGEARREGRGTATDRTAA